MIRPQLVPLDEPAALALRAPLPLDDPQFLAIRRAHFRLDGARRHLSAAFRQAAAVLTQHQMADLGEPDLQGLDSVLDELFPGLLGGNGRGPVADRLARVALQLEESAHEFAAVLSATAETYAIYRADQARRVAGRPEATADD